MLNFIQNFLERVETREEFGILADWLEERNFKNPQMLEILRGKRRNLDALLKELMEAVNLNTWSCGLKKYFEIHISDDFWKCYYKKPFFKITQYPKKNGDSLTFPRMVYFLWQTSKKDFQVVKEKAINFLLPFIAQNHPVPKGNMTLLNLLIETGFAITNNGARRLLSQASVFINDKLIQTTEVEVNKGDVIKVGLKTHVYSPTT